MFISNVVIAVRQMQLSKEYKEWSRRIKKKSRRHAGGEIEQSPRAVKSCLAQEHLGCVQAVNWQKGKIEKPQRCT